VNSLEDRAARLGDPQPIEKISND